MNGQLERWIEVSNFFILMEKIIKNLNFPEKPKKNRIFEDFHIFPKKSTKLSPPVSS